MFQAIAGIYKPKFLGGDRVRSLLYKAYAKGFINYEGRSIHDPTTLTLEALGLRQAEEDDAATLYSLQSIIAAAVSTFSHKGKDTTKLFAEKTKIATNTWLEMAKLLMPWEEWKDQGKIKEEEVDELWAKWERVFGPIDSEENQRKIKAIERRNQIQSIDKDTNLLSVNANWVLR